MKSWKKIFLKLSFCEQTDIIENNIFLTYEIFKNNHNQLFLNISINKNLIINNYITLNNYNSNNIEFHYKFESNKLYFKLYGFKNSLWKCGHFNFIKSKIDLDSHCENCSIFETFEK